MADIVVKNLKRPIKHYQFGYSFSDNVETVLVWQDKNVIRNLGNGVYYIFARLKADNTIVIKQRFEICCIGGVPCCYIRIQGGVKIQMPCTIQIQGGVKITTQSGEERKGQTIEGINN
jgi:hypothetical protein